MLALDLVLYTIEEKKKDKEKGGRFDLVHVSGKDKYAFDADSDAAATVRFVLLFTACGLTGVPGVDCRVPQVARPRRGPQDRRVRLPAPRTFPSHATLPCASDRALARVAALTVARAQVQASRLRTEQLCGAPALLVLCCAALCTHVCMQSASDLNMLVEELEEEVEEEAEAEAAVGMLALRNVTALADKPTCALPCRGPRARSLTVL